MAVPLLNVNVHKIKKIIISHKIIMIKIIIALTIPTVTFCRINQSIGYKLVYKVEYNILLYSN